MMTKYHNNDERLQCFDHRLYIYTSDETDRRCIAPTRRGKRCSWDISEEELEEVVQLGSEAEGLEDGNERNDVLQRLVLARVCGDTHREKLEADPDTLVKVAEMYGQRISLPTSKLRPSQPSPQERQREQTPTPRSPSVMTNNSGQIRHRYLLRPRLAGPPITDHTRSSSRARQPNFVPYQSDPNDHINKVLVSDIPEKYGRDGYVYIFTWPSSPGFVKIGYTSRLVEERISAWQTCSPGATLLLSKSFAFPQRMERLIHLQMAKARHQIIICNTCSSTHYEWFKVSTEEAIQVINDWGKVVERDAIYTSTGNSTERWRERIASMTDELTAQALLGMLDTGAKRSEKDTAVTVRVGVVELDKLQEKTSGEKTPEERTPEERTPEERTPEEKVLEEKMLEIVAPTAVISSLNLFSNKATISTATPEKSMQESQDQMLSIFNDFMLMLALESTKIATVDTRQLARGGPVGPSLQAAAVTA